MLGGGALALAIFLSGPAYAAGNNDGPPAGPVILDLAGQANPHDWTPYTASFVATSTSTALSFAIRDDHAFFYLDDVVLTTGGGPNLVVNGGFEAGPVGTQAPTGWTYLNPLAVTFGGSVVDDAVEPTHSGLFAYADGALQGYDILRQTFLTAIGATYDLSFFAGEDGVLEAFQHLSTNGLPGISGNGVDLVVYAGPSASTGGGVPEPAAWALMTLGLLGVGAMLRSRRGSVALA